MAVDNGDGDEGGPRPPAARSLSGLSPSSRSLFRTISIFNNAGDKEQKAGPTLTPRLLRRGGDEAGTPISSDDAE